MNMGNTSNKEAQKNKDFSKDTTKDVVKDSSKAAIAEGLTLAGKITSAHGIKGQVKIYSYLEDIKNINKYNLYNGKGDKLDLKATSFKNANVAICNFNSSITTRNQAEELANTEFFIKVEDLPQKEEGEFYYDELKNLKVLDSQSNEEIGEVKAIHNFGSGDILEIILKATGKNEMYLFNDANFPEVNLEEGLVKANLPEIVFSK